MKVERRSDLHLGTIVNREPTGTQLTLPGESRYTHLYVAGATGSGKSKLLEHLIRQDIITSRKTGGGLLLIDPHGAVYDALMNWMAWWNIDRPVVPIDFRRQDWVLAYDVLRERRGAATGALVREFVDAIGHAWGQGSVQDTPRFAKWAYNVVRLLYENNLALSDASFLFSQNLKHFRQHLLGALRDQSTYQQWAEAFSYAPQYFNEIIESTDNRLKSFSGTEAMELTFGQKGQSFDLYRALEEGHIVLVNLSTEGMPMGDQDANLFASLLLSDLWSAARTRGKPVRADAVRPFSVYLDEFQRFVTPTIARNLNEARGYGIRMTMANQFPKQLKHAGPSGEELYDSVVVNARNKVIFALDGREDLEAMAESLFRGVMDPDEVKHELYATRVLGYVKEYEEAYSYSTSESSGYSTGRSSGRGKGEGGIQGSDVQSWNQFFSDTDSSNYTSATAWTEARSTQPMLRPVLGKELASVQFRSLEEQLFRAMAVLFDQKQRQCVARLEGMRAPASLFTPFVRETYASEACVKEFSDKLRKQWDFFLDAGSARAALEARHEKLKEIARQQKPDEPKKAKKRVK